jgi:hypothetical protein
LEPPVVGLKVPSAHGSGASVPAGQKYPGGHGPDAGYVPAGVIEVAPAAQK